MTQHGNDLPVLVACVVPDADALDFRLNMLVMDLLMLRRLLSLLRNGSYALLGDACTGVAAERVA